MQTPSEDALPADWTSEELKKTVRQDFGVGADNDLPPNTRFMKNVAQLVRRRLAKGGENGNELAFFILSSTVPAGVTGQTTRIPMLDNALTKLSGNFWFVTESVGVGNALAIPQSLSDDELFSFVVDELSLGKAQTVVLDTRTEVPSVRHYPEGLGNPDNFQNVVVFGAPVTFKEIFASIDRTYKDGLSSPYVHGAVKLWETPTKYIPISDAEKRIQFAIKIGLANAFPTCTVREEQGMPAGRLDLEIEEANPLNRTSLTRHAILELKVLRSFFSGGTSVTEAETCQWVSDGVVQASEYREDRSALAAALCCFDMRKIDTQEKCFTHVITDANARNIALRRWYIHNKAKGYRKAKSA